MTYILKLLNLSVLFCLFGSLLFGFDFSDVHRSFRQDITKIYGNYQSSRVAIVYNNKFQNQLKYKINLVQFKKDLSHELNQSFQIIDPIIVQEILNTNQIDYQQLADDSFILKSFTDRADCTQVLMVDLKPNGNDGQADFRLYTPENDIISQVIMDIPTSNQQEYVQPVEDDQDEGTSAFGDFASNYQASNFSDDHNESWLFFSPTAYINPKENYLDLLTWINDLAEVDIRLIRMRYDYSAFGKLQFGAEVNTIQEKKNARIKEPNTKNKQGIHSSYISARYQVIGDDELPLAFLLGLKYRLYWNKHNTDFISDDKEDEDTDEKNDSYNKATVMGAISGKSNMIGLLYNFYLDNQTAGLGAKYLITSNIKIYLDQIFYYYKNAQIPSDTAIGIQAFSSAGATTTLSYQSETDQIQFGLSVSW